MSRPILTVCLLTYNREEYAQKTLESVLRNLYSTYSEVRYHIADDGSDPDYVAKLALTVAENGFVATMSNSRRKGYGANYNLAMQIAHLESTYILPLEDDWELTKPFNIDDVVNDLEMLGGGCVRLGYIGFTQELSGTFRKPGERFYFELDPDSPEPHVFAGHPRLETVEWSRSVGPWDEGFDPGTTEFKVAHRKAARKRVYWPISLVPPDGNLFAHIGTIRSY